MTRYLRLYAYFLRFSFSRAMEFRVDFFFRIFMDACWYGVHLAFFAVLFRHTGSLGGWNLDQVLVFASAIFLMDGVQMTVFSNNMWWFPIFINRGDLDYYLVRPVSPLFFLSLRDFAANSFVNLLLALGIFGWALARYPEPLGAGRVALFLVLLGGGVLLFYTLSMISLIPLFWMQSRDGFREIFWSLHRFAHRPHRVYTGAVRRVLMTVLPFAFVVSVPASVLFEGAPAALLLHAAAVVAGSFAVMLTLWKLGLRSYASASS